MKTHTFKIKVRGSVFLVSAKLLLQFFDGWHLALVKAKKTND